MLFTCNQCQHRQQKTFSKHSYHKGVVIVRCDGCKALHLVADNLGWFNEEDGRNVEDFVAAKGGQVERRTTFEGRIHVWFYHLPRRDMEELLAAQGIKRSDTGSNPSDEAPHHSEEKDRPKNNA
ncbi:uncharacterized protein MONBRDRAFT_29574 [Monosiga brevicollis MX1]|uniref:DNL-type domain-containing protein n=1 Tax=Monosiga brevicollis TaxID=81824 RepID=A9VBH6_MONBE|nr:uncharacterized protein MONBRDRAFT_29574 [Monosiga brevicollis MX1]EDQ85101.1 predicted protein [Monosiga brevicollis MX1]|eukprot:XP_001750105.1 hypothetical protein [Monosiga brevicollis MX1]